MQPKHNLMRGLIYCCGFLLFSVPVYAQTTPANGKPFGLWLAEFKRDAQGQGISPSTLDEAFADAVPLPRVIALDRKQPETRLTLEQYLANTVTDNRSEQGRKLIAKYGEMLKRISAHYNVQPQFIVALWGIETSYGVNTGGFNIINALATLAYDGRRSDYFRGELLKALQIVEQYHIAPAAMKGSWAGAMGQCQFMPSSFQRFAVDENHDGKPDIWGTQEDVFASIANYLSTSGWNGEEEWGMPVKIPAGFDSKLADIKLTKTQHAWRELGVTDDHGHALPDSDAQLSLILVGEGDQAASFLVTNNYKVLLQWNRSRFFATAVGMLADEVAP